MEDDNEDTFRIVVEKMIMNTLFSWKEEGDNEDTLHNLVAKIKMKTHFVMEWRR